MMTSRSPAITIGIPFYNAESTLLDSVRSVFAQTHENWELILLDDGSTDRSLDIARSIDDPRVRVYSDGQNKRLAARLNEITRLAKFEYMARMDADDLVSSVRLERQLQVFASNPKIDLVSTGVCSLRDDYSPVGIRCVDSCHSISPRGLLNGHSSIVHASILGRRTWFERNPYKENLAISEDSNLWVRAYSRDDLRVAFVPEPLYYYREDGNVSASKLTLSYKVGRHTVLLDAGNAFSYQDKIRAFLTLGGKSVAVRVLHRLGRLDLIRARRNTVSLTEVEIERLVREIAAIRNLELPLRNPVGIDA